MFHFLEIILTSTRENQGLTPDKKASTFDVFAAHRVASLKQLLAEVNVMFVYVPGPVVHLSSSFSISLNDAYKKELKQCFIERYVVRY